MIKPASVPDRVPARWLGALLALAALSFTLVYYLTLPVSA